MKKKIKINMGEKVQERVINYIPVRYIFAFLITLFEILAIIGAVFLLWMDTCQPAPFGIIREINNFNSIFSIA